jgi:lipoprotein-anchoring transpeptidase ErfK/SrfK
MTLTRLRVAAAVVALALGTGCSGSDEADLSLPDGTVSSPDDTGTAGDRASGTGDGEDGEDGENGQDDEDSAEEEDSGALDGEAFIVAHAVDDSLVVRSSAQEGADEVVTLSADDEVSGKIVCLVVQQIGTWVQVELPTGEGERRGWVARDDITLSRHRFRIEVSLSDHSMTLYTGRLAAFTAAVGLGPDAPEAGESLFIKDLVKTPDPTSPYGEYAYGLSGSDNDLNAFTTGNGVVAVHGTGDPSGLGKDVPYGSIAVGAEYVNQMVDTIGLPLGTPVEIVE